MDDQWSDEEVRQRVELARASYEMLAMGKTIQSTGTAVASNTIVRLGEEVLALRAILAGRATPPTRAEIDAHAAAGGGWAWRWTDHRGPNSVRHGSSALPMIHAAAARAREPGAPASRWWPLDASGAPCAWPVVADGAP